MGRESAKEDIARLLNSVSICFSFQQRGHRLTPLLWTSRLRSGSKSSLTVYCTVRSVQGQSCEAPTLVKPCRYSQMRTASLRCHRQPTRAGLKLQADGTGSKRKSTILIRCLAVKFLNKRSLEENFISRRNVKTPPSKKVDGLGKL